MSATSRPKIPPFRASGWIEAEAGVLIPRWATGGAGPWRVIAEREIFGRRIEHRVPRLEPVELSGPADIERWLEEELRQPTWRVPEAEHPQRRGRPSLADARPTEIIEIAVRVDLDGRVQARIAEERGVTSRQQGKELGAARDRLANDAALPWNAWPGGRPSKIWKRGGRDRDVWSAVRRWEEQADWIAFRDTHAQRFEAIRKAISAAVSAGIWGGLRVDDNRSWFAGAAEELEKAGLPQEDHKAVLEDLFRVAWRPEINEMLESVPTAVMAGLKAARDHVAGG